VFRQRQGVNFLRAEQLSGFQELFLFVGTYSVLIIIIIIIIITIYDLYAQCLHLRSRVYSVAAVLYLQSVLLVMLFRT
jgi:hypothetical protein